MGPAPFDLLRSFEAASAVEWIESDGVGGIGSSTLLGVNTRKQHGLLATDVDREGRCVLVSSIQETVIDGTQSFDLSTNAYVSAIHPSGYRNLVAFTADPWPTWRYHCGDVEVERQVLLAHGEHTAVVIYGVVKGRRALKIQARPLLAFRGQNTVRRAHDWNPHNWRVTHEFAECKLRDDYPALYIAHPNATTHTVPLWYRDFLYARDEESSLECVEDLYSPGYFEFQLAPGQPRALVFSTPSPRSTSLVEHYVTEERSRRRGVKKLAKTHDPFWEELLRCAELFIYESDDGRPGIFAGLPWGESDYPSGLIALPGLLLGTRRPEIARDYLCAALETWTRTWIPQAYQATDVAHPAKPLDGPLWLFPAAWHYWTATHDRAFLGDELYPALESVAREYGNRYASHSQTANLVYTRDARHSDAPGSICLTTNALWYNAQETLAEWALILNNGGQDDWTEAASRTRVSVLNRLLSPDGAILSNAVAESGEWRDQSLRSSQTLAIGLPFSVLPNAEPLIARIEAELATPVGLRSLSRQDPAYVGDGSDIRFLPRRWSGSVDPAYFGMYCDALIRAGRALDIKEVFAPLQKALGERGYGCLPGAFSGDAPHRACDYVASACAVGEALRVYMRLTGVGAQ